MCCRKEEIVDAVVVVDIAVGFGSVVADADASAGDMVVGRLGLDGEAVIVVVVAPAVTAVEIDLDLVEPSGADA